MDPDILIGIPTLNGPDRLERCLRSIKRCTPLEEYNAQVVVSDDFSYEKKLAEVKAVCHAYRYPLLMAEQRVGVAEQWNRLVRHTSAPIQILLNDDVELVEHWLEALVYSIRANPHAGMVGLRAWSGVTSERWARPPQISYAEAVMERGVGMLSSQGFAFGFERKKWEAIGGFDTQFFCFYEEIDFGIRLWRQNWPSYMLSYPVILHQGGATTSDVGNIDAKKHLEESREKFKRKHPAMAEIRAEMAMQIPDPWPHTNHWNTLLSAWKD